jgi:hypothetical protein
MSRLQLTKTFKIVKHFKTMVEECHDVTEFKFPNLRKANVSKLKKITEEDNDLRRQASFCHARDEHYY